MICETHCYAPHVLTAAQAHIGHGRHRQTYQSIPALPWYTLHCFSAGNVKLHVNEDVYICKDASACLIPPGSVAQVSIPAACTYIWVDWGVTAVERIPRSYAGLALRYKVRKPQPQPLDVWGKDLPLLLPDLLVEDAHQVVREIVGLWNSKRWQRLKANSLIGGWIADVLCRTNPAKSDSRWVSSLGDSRAATLLHVASQRMNLLHSVTDWAASVGLGRHQLNRIIRLDLGLTATEALNHLRRERVEAQLANPSGEHNLARLASLVGFRHPRSFSNWYETQFGKAFKDRPE